LDLAFDPSRLSVALISNAATYLNINEFLKRR